MLFSVELPLARVNPEGEFQSPEAAFEVIAAVEKSRAAACHVTDHPAPSAHWLHNDPTGHDALDPLATLAFVAAAAPTLTLMTNVLILPYRNPFLTAKAAATVQMLSGGRLILGVGVGYQKAEFDALGVAFGKRGALMDEAIETIRLAWAGGAVVKHGLGFNAEGNEPRPVPRPAPPIWVGGGSTAAVERAARLGDGWAPFLTVPTNDARVMASAVTSLAQLKDKVEQIAARREELGRTGQFDIALSSFWPKEGLTPGGVTHLREQIAAFAEVGVTCVRFAVPAPSRASYVDALAWLSDEVLAAEMSAA